MPVNPQAPQVNDARQADQDSPFALLMAASAPKDDEQVRAQEEAQKPANDQPAAQPAPVKPQSRPESKAESKTEAKSKAKTDEKTKPDETADKDGQDKQEEDVAVANDNAAPATETKATANPVPPAVVPLIVIADAVEKPVTAEASMPQDVAPATAAAAPTQDLAALTAAAARAAVNDAAPQINDAATTPAAAGTQAAPQSQQQTAAAQTPAQQPSTQQTPTQQTPTEQTPAEQASSQQTLAATPQETLDPQSAAPQPVVQPVAAQQTDATQSAASAKETLVQIATLQNPTSAKPAEQTDATAPVSTDLKTDAANPVTHELPAQHADNKEAKADTPRPEMAKPDAVKPDAGQPVPVETTAPKPAPQVPLPPGTNIASVQTTTQPGAAPAALPGIPQHVQVSAQAPAPNMPALAVEIAAKSQSGAKQFDIRLDPPELGRVEVRLSIDAAGKASAHLSADQPQTLDLLQKDASSLTRALREAGLNVSQDGLNFSLRQQNHDGNSAQQGQGRNAPRGMNLIATNSIEATQNSAAWRGDGRLDIRV